MRYFGQVRRPNLRQTGFVITALIGCIAITSAYLAIWGPRYGLDLQVYRAGIHAWQSGKNPYLLVYTIHHLAFTYPPAALLYLTPLNAGPFPVVKALLWVVSIAALAAAIYIVVMRSKVPGRHTKLLAASLGLACLSVLVVEPVRSAIDYGQIDAVLLLMVVTDILVIPRSHRGWVLGIASAIKLTPLVFLILLVVERDWRSIARCIGAFLGSSALMLVVWPSASKQYWLHAAWETDRIGSVAFGGNQSWNGLIYRLPLLSDGRAITWICACLVTVALGVAIASRCVRGGQRVGAMFATAMCGLLISPISWTHHWIWVVLIPPIVLSPAGREMPRSVRVMLWMLLGITVAAPYWWITSGVGGDLVEGLLPVWAAATLLVWFVEERRRMANNLDTVDATTMPRQEDHRRCITLEGSFSEVSRWASEEAHQVP